ncbi:MAG: hypothetical protein AAGC99_05475 [Pseudomonadota bacterium]
MADIGVRIMLPVDGRIISVELDDTMTPDEVINELITENVLPNSDDGYQLAIKGGDQINPTTQLKDTQLTSDNVLRVIPATQAG